MNVRGLLAHRDSAEALAYIAWMPTLALLAFALPGWAHDPITTKLTWTQEISRIVYKRCVSCHKDFTSYEGIRPWAKAIRDEAASRRMPPWGAVKGIGDFVGDPSLSAPEIDMLIAWAEGGAPEGDPVYLPHMMPKPDTVPAIPRFRKSVVVRKEYAFAQPGRVVAIRPLTQPAQGQTEAWAVRPDGEVDRLILLMAATRQESPRSYVFRDPALLPAGTRLKVAGGPGTALTFYIQ